MAGTRTVLYHNDQNVNENAREPTYIHDSDDDRTVKHSNCSKGVASPTCVNANYISDNEDEDWGKPRTAPVPENGLRRSKRVMENSEPMKKRVSNVLCW